MKAEVKSLIANSEVESNNMNYQLFVLMAYDGEMVTEDEFMSLYTPMFAVARKLRKDVKKDDFIEMLASIWGFEHCKDESKFFDDIYVDMCNDILEEYNPNHRNWLNN